MIFLCIQRQEVFFILAWLLSCLLCMVSDDTVTSGTLPTYEPFTSVFMQQGKYSRCHLYCYLFSLILPLQVYSHVGCRLKKASLSYHSQTFTLINCDQEVYNYFPSTESSGQLLNFLHDSLFIFPPAAFFLQSSQLYCAVSYKHSKTSNKHAMKKIKLAITKKNKTQCQF